MARSRTHHDLVPGRREAGKIPFGWTLAGVSLISLAFWVAVAAIIF